MTTGELRWQRPDPAGATRSCVRDDVSGSRRRCGVGERSSGTYAIAPVSLHLELLELDLVNQTLVVDGRTIATTRYQFMMLAHMVANAGRAISAEEFRLQLFRSQHDRSSSNVQRQIHALRQLLESARAGLAEIIENVPSVGYGVGIRRKIAE